LKYYPKELNCHPPCVNVLLRSKGNASKNSCPTNFESGPSNIPPPSAFAHLSIAHLITGVAGVADVARYAQKPQELRQLRPLRHENDNDGKMPDAGVAADVVSPVAPDLGAIEERASLATEERAAQALKADVAPPADVLDSSTRQSLASLRFFASTATAGRARTGGPPSTSGRASQIARLVAAPAMGSDDFHSWNLGGKGLEELIARYLARDAGRAGTKR
jgi:hypothetical protein